MTLPQKSGTSSEMTATGTGNSATRPIPDSPVLVEREKGDRVQHENEAAEGSVAVPEGSQFFRGADDGSGLTPISDAAARRGDVVVLPGGRRAGSYLGDGRVRLEGGEWNEFARLLPSQVEGFIPAAASLDPLAVLPRRPE
jgi:hypothetical protein